MVSCRTITLRKDKFDEREDDFYEALYTQSQAQFATYVQTGTVVNNYAHIFDLLIRLRQVSMPVFKQERRRLKQDSQNLQDYKRIHTPLACCSAVASPWRVSHVLALLQCSGIAMVYVSCASIAVVMRCVETEMDTLPALKCLFKMLHSWSCGALPITSARGSPSLYSSVYLNAQMHLCT